MHVSDAISNDMYDLSKTLHDLSVPLSVPNRLPHMPTSKTLPYVWPASTSWLHANANSYFISGRHRYTFAKPKLESKP
jgi:hypothetical protein